jgi:hypothetical protein
LLDSSAKECFDRVLNFAKSKNYSGYSKFDALNSPLLKALSFDIPLLRLLYIQLVMRAPVNLRPLTGIRSSINPKGIAIFARSLLTMARVVKDADHYRREAQSLLDWLIDHHSNVAGQYHGYCWGYDFDWQSPGFYAPAYMPNCVVSVFAGEALLQGYRVLGDPRYLEVARSTADFLLKDLPVLEDKDDYKCIGYAPTQVRIKVININALTGAFLAKIATETGEEPLRREAQRLMKFVDRAKTSNCAWYYTEPPGDSPITHDNYHTGGILDALLEYTEETHDRAFEDTFWCGLDFYRDHLFVPDGAPKFMSSKQWPYDIHGSAQGIITFTKAACYDPSRKENLRMAARILEWTYQNMYDPRGFFYYQKHRLYTKKFTLMRWCNSWMALAIAHYLVGTARKPW